MTRGAEVGDAPVAAGPGEVPRGDDDVVLDPDTRADALIAIRRALELAEERLERHGLPEALEEGGAQEPLGPPPRDDPEEPGRAHDDRDGQLPHPWAKFRR